jgi:threonine/homoserine/homoserine lactone efflux protein
MEAQRLVAAFAFAMILYGTPGPAIISLTASGAANGFRRSLPYLVGLITGTLVTLAVAAFGLGYLITEFPLVYETLRYASLLYIFYLAYRIARGGMSGGEDPKPWRFGHGILLSLVNPKAYVAAIAIVTQFAAAGAAYASSVLVLTILVAVVLAIVDTAWLYTGQGMTRLFSSSGAARVLNWTLAIALVGSVLLASLSL